MAIKDLVPRFNRSRVPARKNEEDIFRTFQEEMNSLFDSFFGDFFPENRGLLSSGGLAQVGFSPRVDVSETEKELKISAELPGMDEKDVDVELTDDSIIISGERREESEEKGKDWYHREQSYGTFRRVIPLPVEVDTEKAKAKFRKGVLNITIPKKEAPKSNRKTINIETD